MQQKRKHLQQHKNTRKQKTRWKHWRYVFHKPSRIVWLGGLLITIFYVYGFYSFFVGPFSLRWKAFYGNLKPPTGYSIQGIDISHYQGNIDWERLRNATIEGTPIRFVIMKATEGNSLLDENFNDNFYNVKEYGFIRGAYHFFVPSVSAQSQAGYFLKQVHLEDGDFPPVLDIESKGNLSKSEIQQAALTWLQIVEKKYRTKPIIYTNYKFKMDYLDAPVFDTYPYWIAHYYVDSVRYKGRWKLWQHTDCGKLDGIKGRVDCNIYNGSMYELMRFTMSGLNHRKE